MDRDCGDCGRGSIFIRDPVEIDRRRKICGSCIEKKERVIPIIGKKIEYCGVCRCPIISKLHTGCPANKFNR